MDGVTKVAQSTSPMCLVHPLPCCRGLDPSRLAKIFALHHEGYSHREVAAKVMHEDQPELKESCSNHSMLWRPRQSWIEVPMEEQQFGLFGWFAEKSQENLGGGLA